MEEHHCNPRSERTVQRLLQEISYRTGKLAMTGTATGIPGFIGLMISHVTDKSISQLVNVSDNVEMSVSFALNFSPHDKRL